MNCSWKRAVLHFGSSFKSRSTRWIECCNLIFLTLLVKALSLLASSCNSESHYLSESSPYVQTHTHKMPFCLYSSTNIDSFLLQEVTAKCSLGGCRTIIVLLTFHTLFASRCYGWEVPVSVSFLIELALVSPLFTHIFPTISQSYRWYRWYRGVWREGFSTFSERTLLKESPPSYWSCLFLSLHEQTC